MTAMADGGNKPNRPLRPRTGGVGGRKRRVVIDSGAARPRQDSRQARERMDARPKQPPGPPPTGPVTVPSGSAITVRAPFNTTTWCHVVAASFAAIAWLVVGWWLEKRHPKLSEEFTFPVASGWIAGESLMGVSLVMWENAPALLSRLLAR